jgi:MbtH protein
VIAGLTLARWRSINLQSNQQAKHIMMHDEDEDQTLYKVVINLEEQYSIWPADRENPLGWKDVGKMGSKKDCLDYIAQIWTDMRPLSLRKKMDADAAQEDRPLAG